MTTASSRTRALLLAAAGALVVLSTTAGAVHFANADSSHPTTTTSTSTSTTEAPTTTTSTTVPPTTTTAPGPTTTAVRHAAAITTTTAARRKFGPVYDQCDMSIKILQSNPDHLFVTVVDALHPNTNIMVSLAWVTPTAYTWTPDHAFSQSDANGKVVVNPFMIDDWMSGHTLRVSAMAVADNANACQPQDLTLDYSNPANFWN